MIIKSAVFGLLALITLPALSVIPEMEIWSNGTNFRYLLKDWHVDYLDWRVSIKQQVDLIWAVRQLKTEGVLVLAEDTSTYSGATQKIQQFFARRVPKTMYEACINIQKQAKTNGQEVVSSTVISTATPLAYLVTSSIRNGIAAYNAECRHAREIFQFNHLLPSQERITQEEALTELTAHVTEIGKNTWLKEHHAYYCTQLAALKKVVSENNETEFIKKFMEIRLVLVDTKTLNKLTQCSDIKHVFICQGQNHIERIKKDLGKLGYQKTKSIGNALLWDLSYSTPEQKAEKNRQILASPLDLETAFTQIIAEQQKGLSKVPANAVHALKSSSNDNDPSFLGSVHGQKYLAETATVDDASWTAAMMDTAAAPPKTTVQGQSMQTSTAAGMTLG